MWSDNETDVDLLDYRHLVGVTLSIVRNKDLHPTTIGIYGHWGSGKSSLLKMTEKEIRDEVHDVLCVNFNGWLFEGYDDAKSALMDTLLDAIDKRIEPDSIAKDTVVKLSKRVDWMRVAWTGGKLASGMLLGGLGLGITSGIEAVAHGLTNQFGDITFDDAKEFLSQQSDEATVLGIRDFHHDFAELVKESGISTLVVFIDDLDRCNPDTIIQTLEAIKLFLFAPKTVFIIGADERLIKYAVAQRFPELSERDFQVERDYLEKLIQFPIHIPPVGQAELETYIHLLFARLAALDDDNFEKLRQEAVEARMPGDTVNSLTFEMVRNKLGELRADGEENLTLSQFIASVLAPGMSGNPRQTKRFLNLLRMRLEMARARKVDIESRVLAKLMLLEHFRPELFRALAELQIQEQGKPKLLQALETGQVNGSGFVRDEENGHSGHIEDSLDNKNADTWASDDWITDTWVSLDPSLNDVDLRPYFFFARETLGFATAQVRSLSPMAQEIVRNLLHDSQATQNIALQKSTTLDPGEAAAVFGEFVFRARNQEDPYERTELLIMLVRFVGMRSDHVGDLVAFLQVEPIHLMVPSIMPSLKELSRQLNNTSSEAAILAEWAKADSTDIGNLAQKRLDEIHGRAT